VFLATIVWREFGSGSFDPETLVILETAFDEAWITLKSNGSANIRPNELARLIGAPFSVSLSGPNAKPGAYGLGVTKTRAGSRQRLKSGHRT